MRFYIENFGCRATQADGAALERQFLDRGMERASGANEADLTVLNTCTVTEGADKDVRASIRRLQRINPGCRILVTGCYAQRAPEELAALPGVTWVVGNSHKHQAAEIATTSLTSGGFVPIEELSGKPYRFPSFHTERERMGQPNEPLSNVFVGDIFAHTELMAAPVFEAANERTRPNLKVQDGCDNRCSFCVIPFVRGASRSLPAARVLAEVRTLVNAGYREVVISGINLGRWGRDIESSSQFSVVSSQSSGGRPSLVVSDHAPSRSSVVSPTPVDGRWSMVARDSISGSEALLPERPTTNDQRLVYLIRAILDQTSLEKLRVSSVEPMDWSRELIDLVASSPRIARHAHVPMQSGSDAVLRRMHRKYRPWHYREKILQIHSAMPQAAIGADVMVGFPGESDDEFEETRRMVEELPFTYLHVFTYSARPGTPAARQLGQVPTGVARERNRILRELAAAKKGAFLRSLVGSEVEAITLRTGGEDYTEGLTDNYVKIKIGGRLTANRWMRVRVKQVEGDMLIGERELRGETSGQSSAGLVTLGDTTGQRAVDLKTFAALR